MAQRVACNLPFLEGDLQKTPPLRCSHPRLEKQHRLTCATGSAKASRAEIIWYSLEYSYHCKALVDCPFGRMDLYMHYPHSTFHLSCAKQLVWTARHRVKSPEFCGRGCELAIGPATGHERLRVLSEDFRIKNLLRHMCVISGLSPRSLAGSFNFLRVQCKSPQNTNGWNRRVCLVTFFEGNLPPEKDGTWAPQARVRGLSRNRANRDSSSSPSLKHQPTKGGCIKTRRVYA